MKIEYTQQVNSILQSSPSPPDIASHRKSNDTSDTTGDKATQLNSEFMTRLLEKIIAVETVYLRLPGVEQKFIQQYFWEGRRYLDCETYMSVATMKRAKHKIVYYVGVELKEIR